MSYTLTQAKDLVINQGYAIKNDVKDVDKLKQIVIFIFPEDRLSYEIMGANKFYRYDGTKEYCPEIEWHGKSINLSEIELPKQITIEMVIELTKKYTNDMDLGSELRKLLNN